MAPSGGHGRHRVLITSSRRPTPKVRTFLNDLSSVVPSSVRTNRGKASLSDLTRTMRLEEIERLIVVEKRRGNPGSLELYRRDGDDLLRECSLSIEGVTLSHQLPSRECETLAVEAHHEAAEEDQYQVLLDYLTEDRQTSVEEASCRATLSRRHGEVELSFTHGDSGEVAPRILFRGDAL